MMFRDCVGLYPQEVGRGYLEEVLAPFGWYGAEALNHTLKPDLRGVVQALA
jgi:hypothetical protein